MRAPTSGVPSLSSEPTIASTEPCTSPLITSGNSLRPEFLSWLIICSSEPRMPSARAAGFSRLRWRVPRPIVGALGGAGLALDYRQAVARFRRAVEAEHFDRRRRAGLADRGADVGHERAHPDPCGAAP